MSILFFLFLFLLPLLQLVLRDASDDRTTDGAQDPVVSLVAHKTTSKTARYRTSDATLAFLGTARGILLIFLSRQAVRLWTSLQIVEIRRIKDER